MFIEILVPLGSLGDVAVKVVDWPTASEVEPADRLGAETMGLVIVSVSVDDVEEA